jgi:hypothetical protein
VQICGYRAALPRQGEELSLVGFFGEGGKVAQNGRKEDVREGEEMV